MLKLRVKHIGHKASALAFTARLLFTVESCAFALIASVADLLAIRHFRLLHLLHLGLGLLQGLGQFHYFLVFSFILFLHQSELLLKLSDFLILDLGFCFKLAESFGFVESHLLESGVELRLEGVDLVLELALFFVKFVLSDF